MDEAANRTILIFVQFVRLVLLSSIHFPIDISLSGFFFPLFCALVIALEEEKGRKEGRGREKEGRIGAVSRESQNGLDTVSFIPLKQDRLAPRMEDNCNAVANQPCIYTHIYTFEREKK